MVMGNFIILIPFFGHVEVSRPFILFLPHLSFFFLFFSFPSFFFSFFQEPFSSLFSFSPCPSPSSSPSSSSPSSVSCPHRRHPFYFSQRRSWTSYQTNNNLWSFLSGDLIFEGAIYGRDVSGNLSFGKGNGAVAWDQKGVSFKLWLILSRSGRDRARS